MTGLKFTTITTEQEAGILTVRLNRPEKRNSLNNQLVSELQAIFNNAGRAKSVKCVILTGIGSAFCAGADLAYLRSLQGKTKDEHLDDSRQLLEMYKTIYFCPIPVIALVNGPAIGGGCGLVNICDFAIAAEDATFAYPEVRIGFTPAIVSVFLVRSIGYQRARELLLTGKVIDALIAQEYGLINKVVTKAELMNAGLELAGELQQNSPQSMRMTKEFIKYISGAYDFDKLLVESAEFNARSRLTGDFSEGISAFLEKRKPRWQ